MEITDFQNTTQFATYLSQVTMHGGQFIRVNSPITNRVTLLTPECSSREKEAIYG